MGGLIGLIVLVVLAVPVLLLVALVDDQRLEAARVSLARRRSVARVAGRRAAQPAQHAGSGEPTLADWMRTRQPGAAAAAGRMRDRPVVTRATCRARLPRQRRRRPAAAAPPLDRPCHRRRPRTARPRADARTCVHAPKARASAQPRPPSPPDPLTLAARAMRRWFSEGNVPVKVGMLVLFAGVAALLKYATDQGWMRVPDRAAAGRHRAGRPGGAGVRLAPARAQAQLRAEPAGRRDRRAAAGRVRRVQALRT